MEEQNEKKTTTKKCKILHKEKYNKFSYWNNNIWWTLTQDGSLSSGVFTVNVYGTFDYMTASLMQQVRPTLYLSSEIKITGGTGTSSDPYQISL